MGLFAFPAAGLGVLRAESTAGGRKGKKILVILLSCLKETK
jgi:hypothetical protein